MNHHQLMLLDRNFQQYYLCNLNTHNCHHLEWLKSYSYQQQHPYNLKLQLDKAQCVNLNLTNRYCLELSIQNHQHQFLLKQSNRCFLALLNTFSLMCGLLYHYLHQQQTNIQQIQQYHLLHLKLHQLVRILNLVHRFHCDKAFLIHHIVTAHQQNYHDILYMCHQQKLLLLQQRKYCIPSHYNRLNNC